MKRTAAALTALAFVTTTNAQHNDILILVEDQSLIRTGIIDFELGQVLATNQRVFTENFDPFGFSDAPGFNALSSSNQQLPEDFSTLPSNIDLFFDALPFTINNEQSNLFYWDTTNEPNFIPTTDTDLRISKAPSAIFNALLEGEDLLVPGFLIDDSSSSGFLHRHIAFRLTNQNAAEGIYVFSLQLRTDTLLSEPLYLVHTFGTVSPSTHAEAAQYIQDTLVDPPCRTDSNDSGSTEIEDLLIVLRNFGTTINATISEGDTDNDGDVDIEDLLAVLREFGTTC